MKNDEKERLRAGLCIVEGCGKARMEFGTGSGYRSNYCRAHYRQHDKRSRHAHPTPVYDTDTVLAKLHELRPLPEVPDYVHTSADGFVRRGYVVKCVFWRRRVDAWLLLNGTYRPPREFDDAERARATARLDELMKSEVAA